MKKNNKKYIFLIIMIFAIFIIISIIIAFNNSRIKTQLNSTNETTKAVESTNKPTTIGSKTNTTVKSNTNKTSTAKSTKTTTTGTFKTSQFIIETKTVRPPQTTTMVQQKHTCTMNDEKWATKVKWINSQNEMVFNSLEEALAYGNYAMNIGYAYWYNPDAYHYEDATCEKDYYTVEVYITKYQCKLPDGTTNPNIYLPATPRNKLIGKIDYLVSLGYECPGKRDPLSGNQY